MRIYFLLFIIVGCLTNNQVVFGQDTTGLVLDRLEETDLVKEGSIEKANRMISGSRTAEDRREIPFTVQVVTRKEILENGYTTLPDALKGLPGIRVSQPGSGIDGETFMIRGLYGNSYAKILLNDVPIKPSMVGGMPIGAQLPIRHAERIEVIYGPGATLYGADASGGVINIITKESERPVYVQADLSAGSNGYSNVDVMLGGKLGQGKNIFRYNVYGSNTLVNSRATYYALDELYNPTLYAPGNDTSYVNNANYQGSSTSPLLNELPHLSRLIGISGKYRIFSFSTNLMYRRDHVSIGLNPVAVSYANPNNYFGESIINVQFSLKNDREKFGYKTGLSYLRYDVDDNSSVSYINDSVYRVMGGILNNIPVPFVRDSLSKLANQTLFDGNRYFYSTSNDLRVEQLFYWRPSSQLNFTFGVNGTVGVGIPLLKYLPAPYQGGGPLNLNQYSFPEDGPVEPLTTFTGDASFFVQGRWVREKFRAYLGLQYYVSFYGPAATPRVALLYKPSDGWNIRGIFGTAFRVPSPFYEASTYKINFDALVVGFEAGGQDLQPERTDNYELGIRWYGNEHFELDVAGYYMTTKRFLSYNFNQLRNFEDNEFEFTIGY